MIRIFLKRVIQPKILNKKILSVSFLTSIKNIDASNKKILLKECSNDDDDEMRTLNTKICLSKQFSRMLNGEDL